MKLKLILLLHKRQTTKRKMLFIDRDNLKILHGKMVRVKYWDVDLDIKQFNTNGFNDYDPICVEGILQKIIFCNNSYFADFLRLKQNISTTCEKAGKFHSRETHSSNIYLIPFYRIYSIEVKSKDSYVEIYKYVFNDLA